jgi:hypothetical protein
MESTLKQSSETALSDEQIKALEHIARENHTTRDALVSLALDALITEAGRHGGWLPLPEIPKSPSPLR